MTNVPPQHNARLLLRFTCDLHLLRRLLPVILCLIALASSTPQFFLWYIGELLKCPETACQTTWLSVAIPLSLRGLILVAACGIGLRIVSWLSFEATGMWSTGVLHDRMIAALAAARTTYFDETPSGHLLNRITGDFGNLRFMGIIRLGDATNAFVEVASTMVLVGLMNPWPAVLMVPVTVVFLRTQLAIGPMLGHCEEIASKHRGEVLHRATDLIEGRRIYSLYGKEKMLLASLHAAFVLFTDARLLSARLQAWSRLWTRWVAAVYGFAVCLFLALGVQQGRLSLPLAAVILSALFALSGSLGWLSWCLAFISETLGNARRVYELVDLPREELAERPLLSPLPLLLPPLTSGAIVFSDFSASYRAGQPLVLKGCSLTIAGGSRVGVIGRTGAGKSSLIQALYRMLHVSGGDITIAGQSIYAKSIEEVRALFAIVPQSPYLFSGSLRHNLDRYSGLPGPSLEAALAAVGLKLALDFKVEEGGRNLSLGERQLVCLARVLVSRKPFLLVDEPTSAVDLETDSKIQRLLFEQFPGRTLITIAHRLETLRLYDQVIVLDDGRVARSGTPAEILNY